MRERKFVDGKLDRVDNRGIVVAEARHRRAARPIEVAFAIGIDQVTAVTSNRTRVVVFWLAVKDVAHGQMILCSALGAAGDVALARCRATWAKAWFGGLVDMRSECETAKLVAMNIVFFAPGNAGEKWLSCLAEHFPRAEIWVWTPDCAAKQADYAVVWAPPTTFFASQWHLKAIFNLGAGVDRIVGLPDAVVLLRGVPVIRLLDAGMGAQMAEYVCHAIFRQSRQFAAYQSQQDERVWKQLPPIKRAAWPVGVMGLGAIGARVAEAVAAFEYPVFGWTRMPRKMTGITTFAGVENLDAFLRAVRVLVCVLPLTDDTRGIVNHANLSRLQPNGYLINVARGGHLVDEDLLSLLDEGAMAGATLDVFHDEPLPPEHPFWWHPKICLTPHIAATTLLDESVAQIAANIAALERGDRVTGIVALSRGY